MNTKLNNYQHPGLDSPPRDLWPDIESRLASEFGHDKVSHPRRWTVYAAAASVLLTVALSLAVLIISPQDSHAAAVDRWQGYTDKLETQLKLINVRPRVARGHQLVTLRRLNQQLGQLDTRLQITADNRLRLQLLQQRSVKQLELINAHSYTRYLPYQQSASVRHSTTQQAATELYEL